MGKTNDITGMRQGMLVAVKLDHRTENYRYMWLCKCDCGNEKVVDRGHFVRGNVKTCGCQSINKTHGLSGSRFDKIYWNMIRRCKTDNEDYGGRGIVCHWKSLKDFADDMLQSYKEHSDKFGENDTFIDRINNDGDYRVENCKWSTRKENNNNRRKRRWQKRPL